MKLVFQVKRVLDRMDKLGPQYSNIDDCARKASAELLMFDLSPIVLRAKEYAKYELKCLSLNRKPKSLAQWMKMQRYI